MTTDDQQLLYFNGVNGDSGTYDLPPMSGDSLVQFIQGEGTPENLSELKDRERRRTQAVMGVKEGVDPKKLDESGWGVIFAHDVDPAIKEALSELLNLRQKQAGAHFRLYEGSKGHRPDESKGKFLARHGAGPGPADPDKVPYYLLIVGDPDRIPYRFQSQLDVQYAVGRIHFNTLDEYANYARSVVEAETKPLKLPRQITFFGVDNPDDQATELSTNELIEPLSQHLTSDKPTWQTTALVRDQATKSQLARLLGGDQTPALLFSASHGMSFSIGSERQLAHQGALLCQDWPGPQSWSGAIPQDFYFAGDDLSSDANLLGLIGFFFACYGGGTPRLDEFAKQAFRERSEIAPHAFLAQLPVHMLGHPKGGALAIIGHVERAWGYSFNWPGAGRQTETFKSTLRSMLAGNPVGHAVEYFNERYAELATVLSDELEEIEFGKRADPYELSGMWTANNDARGYAVIGDPAVRLQVAEVEEQTTVRPVIEVQPVAPPSDQEAIAGFSVEFAGDGSASGFAELQTVTITTTVAAGAGAGEQETIAIKTTLELSGEGVKARSEEAATEDANILSRHRALVEEIISGRQAMLS